MIELLCKIIAYDNKKGSLIDELGNLTEEEWYGLINLSEKHGLDIYVYKFIVQQQLEDQIPNKLLVMLHEESLRNATRNMLYIFEAAKLFQVFLEADIHAVGLKGVYLLDNIYQDISLRKMSDLDILVKKKDLPATIDLAKSLGFYPTTYFDISDENIDIKHVPPLKKEDGPYLELHWTILEENEPFTIDTEGLWQRAVLAKINDVDVLAFCPEDLILHLCVHLAYQHHLSIGLRGLVDIIEVWNAFKDVIDWQKLIEISTAWGANRVVALTFTLIEDLFNITYPEELLTICTEHIPTEILEKARNQVLLDQEVGNAITPDLAQLSSTKQPSGKIKLILSRVFLPKRVIARIYNADPTAITIYFYYFVRFRDLIRYYGKSVWGIIKHNSRTVEGVENMKAQANLQNWLVS